MTLYHPAIPIVATTFTQTVFKLQPRGTFDGVVRVVFLESLAPHRCVF